MRSTVSGGPSTTIDESLLIYLDAANINSYLGTGTAWNDLTQTNNSTLRNGPVYNSDIKSFTFDGTNDYASFASEIPFLIPTFTVVSWVSPLTFNTQGTVIFTHKDSSRLLLGTNYGSVGTSGGIYIRVVGSSSTLDAMTFDSSVVLNKWYQYSFVIDLPGQNIKGYINGIEVYSNTNNYGSDFSSTGTGGHAPVIASRYGGISDNTNIKVATFSFYNRALSATEVLNNYSSTKTRFGL